jgi:hypothetical protein
MECMAIDFEDPHHDFYNLCEDNIECLEKCRLYMESGLHTPSWTHLQIRPTHNRIFLP